MLHYAMRLYLLYRVHVVIKCEYYIYKWIESIKWVEWLYIDARCLMAFTTIITSNVMRATGFRAEKRLGAI